jgi:hypothetical protein
LETVVLDRDIPERGLRAGDLATVVELYELDGPDVEFARASEKTQALVIVKTSDVRDEELVSVQTVARGAA